MSDIDEKYAEHVELLGDPVGPEKENPDGVGKHRVYANGRIYWHPDTGAWEVHGAILTRWLEKGGPSSPLGCPKRRQVPLHRRLAQVRHRGGAVLTGSLRFGRVPAPTKTLALAAGSLLLAFVAACSGVPRAPDHGEAKRCQLAAKPETIAVESPIPGELHLVYELADGPWLWAPAPEDDELRRYREALRSRVPDGLRPRDLLERQRRILSRAGSERAGREASNATLLLDGRAGKIAPASCLEVLLFRVQARRFAMIAHPTEFGAFILRRGDRLRVYLSGADRVGGKLRGAVTDRVKADVAAGFEPIAHLHNHPFLFDRVVGDRMWTRPESIDDIGGALAPSTVDVQLYRRLRESLKLRAAWITNGLDTVRIPAAGFERFSAK